MSATVIKTENIVLTIVTSQHGLAKRVLEMNKDYFEAVCAYKSAMAQARLMLLRGILTKDEHAIIDTMMGEKYGLSSCSLFRDIDLIYKENDGSMSQ